MKKIIVICLFAFATATSVSAASINGVNEKVLKVFSTSFPEVLETTWYNYDNYYAVYFKNSNGSKCRIEYDFDGNILSTTRYYSQDGLPPFIRAKVNQKYPGRNIFGVTEISSGEELTYHIVLEDANNWYNINSDAIGLISLEKKMKKAEN